MVFEWQGCRRGAFQAHVSSCPFGGCCTYTPLPSGGVSYILILSNWVNDSHLDNMHITPMVPQVHHGAAREKTQKTSLEQVGGAQDQLQATHYSRCGHHVYP